MAVSKKHSESCSCPVYRIIETISKKWCLHILRALADKKIMRYSEIRDALPDINSRMLSERLTELEAEGLLTRTVKSTKPISIEYAITEKGMDLRKVFDVFCTWAKRWGERQ